MDGDPAPPLSLAQLAQKFNSGQTVPPTGGDAPAPKLSIAELVAQHNSKIPAQPSLLQKAGNVVKQTASYLDPVQYYKDFTKSANEYADALRNDLNSPTRAQGETPAVALGKDLKRVLKTALDAGGAAFSPVTTGVDRTIVKPLQDAVGVLGGLIEEHVDNSGASLQKRREAYPGKPAFDPALHVKDVEQTIDSIQKFLDIGIQTGVGMLGGGEASVAESAVKKTADKLEGAGALKDADRKLKPRMKVVEGPDGKPMLVPSEPPLEMREERPIQGFYSGVLQSVVQSPTKSASREQWAATLNNAPGVKAEELQWIGVNDWLKDQKGPVTKEALAGFIRDHQVDMHEVNLTDHDTEYNQYVTPGKYEDYTERLYTKPPVSDERVYKERHWPGEQNVIAHSRETVRADAYGDDFFHIEEIQSQLHQEARERGYIDEDPIQFKFMEKAEKLRPAALDFLVESNSEESFGGASLTATPFSGPTVDFEKILKNLEQTITQAGPRREAILAHARKVDNPLNNYLKALYDARKKREPPVPKLPFSQTQAWTELVFKRLVKEAVDRGLDRISWAHGDDQIARYHGLTAEQKAGLKKYYDETLPAVAEKFGKKYGAKVKTLEIGHEAEPDIMSGEFDEDVTPPSFSNKYKYLEITPKMQLAAKEGQRLFNQARDPRLEAIKGSAERLSKAGQAIRLHVMSGKPVPYAQLAKQVISQLGPDHPMSKALQRILDAGANIPVVGKGANAFDKENVHAFYQPAQNGGFIVLRRGGMSSDISLVHDLAHEGVHAVTYAALRRDPVLAKHMEGLMDLARIALGKENHYGLTKLDEFVAEAFSNRHFQNELRKVKIGPQTAWQHFVDIVRKLMNLPREETNLLDEVMKQEERLFKGSDENKKLTPAEWRKKLPNERSEGEKPRLRIVGQTESGKPRVRVMSPEEASAATRESIKNAQEVVDRLPSNPKWLESESLLRKAANAVANVYSQMVATFSPGGASAAARVAEAVIAKAISEQMRESTIVWGKSEARRGEWNKRLKDAFGFITSAEKGKRFADPWLQETAEFYRGLAKSIFENDRKMGHQYEPIDNYIYHLFENPDKVADWLTKRYGTKWGDPSFTKDRVFDLYEQALKEGFKPKFTNPEHIMLARQHASSIANMQIGVLGDLKNSGLAVVKVGKKPPPFTAVQRRAPNGVMYWVHKDAEQILHNAFDQGGLWADRSVMGSAFRGAMAIKNTLVPLRLMVSLFHPLHVLHIDTSAGIARALQGVLSGAQDPVEALKSALSAGLLQKSLWDNPRAGGRLRAMWNGTAPVVTDADRAAMTLIAEGGFIPEMSEQYRTKALTNLKDAIQQRRLAKGALQLPGAIVSALQKPIFEWWIPNLKVASYLNDARTLLEGDPSLATDALKRQTALRRLAKSVDNRYGEMSYNTLFWNKWVKDLAVMDTLSLGWNLGFVREFPGAVWELGQASKQALLEGKVREPIKSGMLWKPIYASVYLTSALGLGGLMTYALSGKQPDSWEDYVYPKTGGNNPDGSPKRSNTMFYTREFGALYKHMQQEGIIDGLSDVVLAKGSGVMTLMHDLWTGKDIYGHEFRDESNPWYKRIEEDVVYAMSGAEPMSLQSIKGTLGANKETAMAVAGFTPAPRYATESKTEAAVMSAYRKYVQPQDTPYLSAQKSKEYAKARELYAAQDAKFDKAFDAVVEKYELQGQDIRRLEKSFDSDEPVEHALFKRLPWPVQKSLLDQMNAKDREEYVPLSNKRHLRDNYEPPK